MENIQSMRKRKKKVFFLKVTDAIQENLLDCLESNNPFKCVMGYHFPQTIKDFKKKSGS